MSGRAAETWDQSLMLIAWSRALVAQSQRLVRPVFRGGSDPDSGMIRVTDLTGIRIMLVDDDQDNVEVLATFLRMCGATALAARRADETLSSLDVRPPVDLLLTDLSMPRLSGFELVQRVRAHPAHASLPAIAVSGFPENYFATDAECFSAFILKPVDLDALAATVKRLVTIRHPQKSR